MSDDRRQFCTLETCSVEQYGWFTYIPTIPGNAVYLAIFAALILVQLFQAWKFRIYGGFAIGMVFGIVLEIVGYAGRIMMGTGNGIFSKSDFIMQLVCLTIGPAFLSAAIYLCLGRVVNVYGREYSRIRPATYSIIFISFDFISLVLQAAGGAIASTGKTPSKTDMGTYIMVAGLAFQVFSLSCFIIAGTDFYLRVKKGFAPFNPDFIALRSSSLFKGFLWALGIATCTITIRSTYRIVELAGGFHSKTANNEPSFMVLEGPMVIVACLLLTVFHPGYAFRGQWHEADFKVSAKKDQALAATQGFVKEAPSP